MYCLIVYNDFNHDDIIFIGYFKSIKNISIFSNQLIKYGDIDRQKNKTNKTKFYKSKKSLFEIIKI